MADTTINPRSYRYLIAAAKKRAATLAYAGLTLILIGAFLSQTNRDLGAIAIVGIVLAFLGITRLLFRIRCPRCGGNLGYATMHPRNPFSLPATIRFCPQCGVNIDDEIPDVHGR